MSYESPTPSPALSSEPGGKREGRRWWIGALVIVGIGAAFAIGFVIGGNSRDDDVAAARAEASQADDQAVDAISNGFRKLADAIAQQDTQDDQATQAAIDEATDEIEGALQQMGETASENVTNALDDLRNRIGEAVESRTTETTAPDGG